ncbi:MAG: hypothetical protein Q9191_002236 [Dirinaria sp. TL-2023a]
MATILAQRQRSNTSVSTSSSHPAQSCPSTASAHSATAQPSQQHQYQPLSRQRSAPTQEVYPIQYRQAASHTPEETSTHGQSQFPVPYGIDPSLRHEENRRRSMSAEPSHTDAVDTAGAPFGHRVSYDEAVHPTFQSVNDEQAQEDTGTEAGRKKKGSASSAANDMELKRLFAEHRGRPLKEVAAEVIVHERGPRSEKTKQIFAMLCTGSVPRSRVFSHYAKRCGTERVPPLNPASFGKLVRIIFPGISTRRLGMRGESKYHYVDLSLVDEQPDYNEGTDRGQIMRAGSCVPERPNLKRQRSQPPADTAAFPAPDEPYFTNAYNTSKRQKVVSGSLLVLDTDINMDQIKASARPILKELKWPLAQEEPYQEEQAIKLPDIYGYVPPGTDPDAANALMALYRSHCISVIDCFRFCKEKMLWHHFTCFHGTLTVPVQKLLAHSDLAAWIKGCDWSMYQNMVRFVAPLALQVVPHRVLDTFKIISRKLTNHIDITFQNLPQHVRDAKLAPATLFAGLLDRLLRVNATAHAAANMLTSDANREQMWQDWCLHVKPGKVVEASLANIGEYRTLWILTRDVRNLLGPLQCIAWEGMESCYHKANREAPPDWSQHGHAEHDESTEGVLDRWTDFLYTLPSRFPHADARELIDRTSQVCNAALRDITMAQALSFGSWWITKCWIDEMLLWITEKGGFMDPSSQSTNFDGTPAERERIVTANEAQESFARSRPRTAASASVDTTSNFSNREPLDDFIQGAEGFQQQQSSQAQPQQSNVLVSRQPQPGLLRAHSFHPEPTPEANPLIGRVDRQGLHRTKSASLVTDMRGSLPDLDDHDDSGIGLGLEDEDLNLSKYHGFIAAALGSDPADVRVC